MYRSIANTGSITLIRRGAAALFAEVVYFFSPIISQGLPSAKMGDWWKIAAILSFD